MRHEARTNRTADGIRAELEKMMANNPRKQVFVAVAEAGGCIIVAGPESDCISYGSEFHGFCGIRRQCWKDVPGYAARVCQNLSDIMMKKS